MGKTSRARKASLEPPPIAFAPATAAAKAAFFSGLRSGMLDLAGTPPQPHGAALHSTPMDVSSIKLETTVPALGGSQSSAPLACATAVVGVPVEAGVQSAGSPTALLACATAAGGVAVVDGRQPASPASPAQLPPPLATQPVLCTVAVGPAVAPLTSAGAGEPVAVGPEPAGPLVALPASTQLAMLALLSTAASAAQPLAPLACAGAGVPVPDGHCAQSLVHQSSFMQDPHVQEVYAQLLRALGPRYAASVLGGQPALFPAAPASNGQPGLCPVVPSGGQPALFPAAPASNGQPGLCPVVPAGGQPGLCPVSPTRGRPGRHTAPASGAGGGSEDGDCVSGTEGEQAADAAAVDALSRAKDGAMTGWKVHGLARADYQRLRQVYCRAKKSKKPSAQVPHEVWGALQAGDDLFAAFVKSGGEWGGVQVTRTATKRKAHTQKDTRLKLTRDGVLRDVCMGNVEMCKKLIARKVERNEWEWHPDLPGDEEHRVYLCWAAASINDEQCNEQTDGLSMAVEMAGAEAAALVETTIRRSSPSRAPDPPDPKPKPEKKPRKELTEPQLKLALLRRIGSKLSAAIVECTGLITKARNDEWHVGLTKLEELELQLKSAQVAVQTVQGLGALAEHVPAMIVQCDLATTCLDNYAQQSATAKRAYTKSSAGKAKRGAPGAAAAAAAVNP